MVEFDRSALWQATLAEQKKDQHSSARERLRTGFLRFRSKVTPLVNQIHKDMPGYTVHDITHLDALWNVASEIAGSDYPLNPAEAFVLGGAFLLHDAGMTLAAFPNGVEDLRKTLIWRDIDASGDHDQAYLVTEVLRQLHPETAKDLSLQTWKLEGEGEEYLIEDAELRLFYGPIIGEIAHSHWLSAGQLPFIFQTDLGAMPTLPPTWRVDPIKVAALLRVADAAHIDAKRAPQFIRYLTKPSGYSSHHWYFQSLMAQCYCKDESLHFSSSQPFDENHTEAWWLAVDAISMIDRELREVDLLLEDYSRPRFRAKRVKAANSIEALQKLIKVRGWTPIDAKIQISSISKIVARLGGSELYGEVPYIPVRELLQNGLDAIRAKIALLGKSSSSNFIRVRILEPESGSELVVEDTGIGMSRRVLTTTLLDFGESFWSSALARNEFPGLQEKRPKMGGRYGMGFFSVFMIADHISITSKRYDASLNEFCTLHLNGLVNRPLLKPATNPAYFADISTQVQLKLKSSPRAPNGFLIERGYGDKTIRIPAKLLVGALAPCADTDIYVEEDNELERIITGNDWQTLKGPALVARVGCIKQSKLNGTRLTLAKNLRPLIDDQGTIYGRAALTPQSYTLSEFSFGAICGSGIRIVNLRHVLGILFGEPAKVSRDAAIPTVPREVLVKWATEQATLCSEQDDLDEETLFDLANIVLSCGGDPSPLPVLRYGDDYLTREDCMTILETIDELTCCTLSDLGYSAGFDDCTESRFDNEFIPEDGIYIVHDKPESFIRLSDGKFWPQSLFADDNNVSRSTAEYLENMLVTAWGEVIGEIEDTIIGYVGGVEIKRTLRRYCRGTSDS